MFWIWCLWWLGGSGGLEGLGNCKFFFFHASCVILSENKLNNLQGKCDTGIACISDTHISL